MNAPNVAAGQIWICRRRSFRIVRVGVAGDPWTLLRRCIPETGAFDPKAREFAVETLEFAMPARRARYFYSGMVDDHGRL